MLIRLAMLFILLPLVELALLLFITDKFESWFATLALVILTGVVGAWLARREGLNCYRRVQQQVAQGQLPADSLLDGLMILIAGAFLVTPGIITDSVGFALLVPRIRRTVRRQIVERIKARLIATAPPPQSAGGVDYDEIIDVEYRAPNQRRT
jgi:UPF0716 protein FxsA